MASNDTTATATPPLQRCAIYTRKSHEEGLDQEFNSLDAQRDAAEAYIESQKQQGWVLLHDHYDDGGYSGGSMDRPALHKLLSDIEDGKIDIVVVYKLDRLSRSLLDFIKMVEHFNARGVSFVSVTQQISTTDSTGRMMLNILMTFAQYEREATAERIRDKIAGAKRRGKYCGGMPVYGYDVDREQKKLVVNEQEAGVVKYIFRRYAEHGSAKRLCRELNEQGYRTKSWVTKKGVRRGGAKWTTHHIYRMLSTRLYLGQIVHRDTWFPGEHKAIITQKEWDRVKKVAEDPKPDKMHVSQARVLAPLQGVVRCGHCDGALTPTYTHRGHKLYSYYICQKDAKRDVSACPLKRIPAGDIEAAVFKQLSHVLQTPTLIAKTYFALGDIREAEQERLTYQKQELEQRLEKARLKAEMLKGNGSSKSGLAAAQQAEGHVKTIQTELDQISERLTAYTKADLTEQDVTKSFQNLESLWNELFPEERNRLVRLLVKKVVIFDYGVDLELKTKGLTSLASELAGLTSATIVRKAQA